MSHSVGLRNKENVRRSYIRPKGLSDSLREVFSAPALVVRLYQISNANSELRGRCHAWLADHDLADEVGGCRFESETEVKKLSCAEALRAYR